MDQLFRDKAAEINVDAHQVEMDWQNMRSLLAPSHPAPSKPASGGTPGLQNLFYVLAAAAVVTAVVILTPNKKSGGNENHNETPVTSAKQENTPNPVNTAVIPPVQVTTSDSLRPVTIKKQPVVSAGKEVHLAGADIPVKTIQSTGPVKSDKKETIPASTAPDPQKLFDDFYEALKKPVQVYNIDPRRDTTIVCKEGTRLVIPAGTFQSGSGENIKGNVTLKIQEFYLVADIIGNKLSTSSNGMPIETGGMLYIEAIADHRPAKIRNGSGIDIKMPTNSFEPSMQLFTGEVAGSQTLRNQMDTISSQPVLSDVAIPNTINWIAQGQQQFFMQDSRKLIRILDLRDEPYAVRTTERRTVAKFMIPYSCPISTEEMRKLLTEKHGGYYDVIKVKRGWREWKKIDRAIQTNEWHLYDKIVGDTILIPLHLASRQRLITREDSLVYEEKFRKELEEAVKFQRSYREYLKMMNDYNFRITDLGWINCDRFLGYPRSRLTDFSFDPGPGFEGVFLNASLVFENEKAIMAGSWNQGKINFFNIPLGHKVSVICAGVKDGKMYSCVMPFTVQRPQSPKLQMEVTSPEVFREKLLKLGTVK